MNSFLDLHIDADYRNINRPYYKGTWEYVNIASTYLIPFQFTSSGSDSITVETEDTDGNFEDITLGFINSQAANLVTLMTKTGGGTWSAAGAVISAGTIDTGGYMTSNTFTLTAGVGYYLTMLPAYDTGDMEMKLQKNSVDQWSKTIDPWVGEEYFTVDETDSDYSFVLINSSGAGSNCTATNTPFLYTSDIVRSGDYWWYDGSQLVSTTLEGILRLRITVGADIFYSDWCDVCGFDDKMKLTISSSYDYGGIKYVGGYEQWMYKNATVRRAPKAEIEVLGDKLNGAITEEKKTSAVRYKIAMKCTEAEYEALVHAMGGTLEIVDQTGKTYTAVNIELTDPTWYHSNGIVELSFVDSGNINIWTRNNTTL